MQGGGKVMMIIASGGRWSLAGCGGVGEAEREGGVCLTLFDRGGQSLTWVLFWGLWWAVLILGSKIGKGGLLGLDWV